MAAVVEKRKPVFVTIDSLRPGSKGQNLTIKVVEAKTVVSRPKGPKGQPIKVAECIIGDATGSIVFTAKNDQVELASAGSFLTLRNAKVDMFKGSMRLCVDQWGKVEVAADDTSFNVKLDNNLSLVEYELVTVPADHTQSVTAGAAAASAAAAAAMS